PRVEHPVLEFLYHIVKIVDQRHIVVDELVQYLVKQVRRPTLTCEWARQYLLLYGVYAAKCFGVKGHHKIAAQIPVKLFRNEIGRARFVRPNAVHDKIKIIWERLDLWLIAGLDAVLDRQVMKLEDLKQQALDLLLFLGGFPMHVDPGHDRWIPEQFG